MKRCASGHYYDPDKYSNCPLCGVDIPDIGATRPNKNGHSTGPLKADDFPDTIVHGSKPHANRPESETVGVFMDKAGIDPVVGWLVCIDGVQKGKDYRLKSERNFIGRADNMYVCIKGDETISRNNHAVVSYNPKSNSFKVLAGDSSGIVYLNGEEVDTVKDLKAFDVIELGKTKLKFFPCCGDNFKWEV
ncbi:MAG: FHA domain-containing protein [Nitrospirae bacterium]|nr:FHA domain-containing protein [Nitrospirota bacterium]